MRKYKRPIFEVHDHGTCDFCNEENVDLYCMPEYLNVCRDCFQTELTLCDECGQLWASDFVEFTCADDDRVICEFCREEMQSEGFVM